MSIMEAALSAEQQYNVLQSWCFAQKAIALAKALLLMSQAASESH